ncbi:hypothetical protein D3C80_773710 [compost metagenome]
MAARSGKLPGQLIDAGGARRPLGVQDHDDGPVAQDGRPGIEVEVAQHPGHRLDHDLLDVEDPVDDDAEGAGPEMGDHDAGLIRRLALRRGRGVVAQLQQALQRHQRQQPLAQAQHRGLLDCLDVAARGAAGADQFDDRRLGQGEPLAARLDDQGRDDGQGQRDADGEAGAPALDGVQFDGAADLLDVGAHHVHADAPARDAGDLGCGRETRAEDQLHRFGVAHLFGLGGRQQVQGNRLGAQARHRQAAPVVGHFDDDGAAFVARRQGDAPGLGLAGGAALVRRLQPVIGGVADHVGQRVADQLHDLPVQLGLLAGHVQFDALAQFVLEVAYQTRQLGPGAADRLHPRDHDFFLDLAGHLIEAMQRGLERAFRLQPQGLDHLVADQHQLADRAHQLFQHLDVDADGGGGLACASGLRGVI